MSLIQILNSLTAHIAEQTGKDNTEVDIVLPTATIYKLSEQFYPVIRDESLIKEPMMVCAIHTTYGKVNLKPSEEQTKGTE